VSADTCVKSYREEKVQGYNVPNSLKCEMLWLRVDLLVAHLITNARSVLHGQEHTR
jgi:hypothetical protein